MIKYSIRGENLEVTEAIHDYVVSKLEKIEKYFENCSSQSIFLDYPKERIDAHKKVAEEYFNNEL